MNIKNMVSPLRKKQISFTVKVLIFALAAGVLVSMVAELMIYNVSEKAVNYMFMEDVSFQ